MNASASLVSVVTPVYNGETFLVKCIESVLAQSYGHWEYIIANNCSTDNTRAIAEQYANRDPRIRVHNFNEFVGVIESHNRALTLISQESRFCKIISADDWITPDCLAKMVELAEKHPSAAIIGSYQSSGEEILFRGLPPEQEIFSGREISRLSLLSEGWPKSMDAFGNPTSLLYRSDIIKNHEHFFPHLQPYADTSACYEYLRDNDFGFVHSVLSGRRIHDDQITEVVRKTLDVSFIACLEHVMTYGPVYLSADELTTLEKIILDKYYRHLGACILQLKGAGFWKFHVGKVRQHGYSLLPGKILKGMIMEALEELHHPGEALRKFLDVLKEKALFAK
jgi:glycosyltransferase involved in cell wall biosynthesis